MKDKPEKDKFPWGMIVFVSIFFLPFVALFIIDIGNRHGETLTGREIIFQRIMNEGQAMVIYLGVDRLHFADDAYNFTFNLSEAPKVLQDLALHKASLQRPRIKREEIIPQASWFFRSGQKILVYPELEIVALVEGDFIVGCWKIIEAPEAIKKWINKDK